MRAGVVPIATDAGAVTDVVRSWQNGVVLSQTRTVAETVAALRRSESDRALLEKLSEAACNDMRYHCWDYAVAPVKAHLDRILAYNPV